MSHLFKKNKKFLKITRLLLFLTFSFIFLKTIFLYSGNKIIYFLFSIISFYLIIFSFRKKSLFYENFFGVFLLLGFWSKLSFILILKTNFTEGWDGQNIVPPNIFDNALISSSIGILGFIIFGHLRELFFSYPTKLNFNIDTKFYETNRKLILIFFVFLFVIISYINNYFQIYQRGLIGQSYNFIFSGFVKTSLLYFLSLCSAIILYYEAACFKRIFLFIFLLVFLESFLSSVSMLSRGMIFNSFALVFAFYKLSNKINLKINYSYFLKVISILILIFVTSIFYINQIRINIHSDINANNQKEILNINEEKINKSKNDLIFSKKVINFLNKSIYRFKHLLIHRWVGIDSMIVINNHRDKLSLNLFKDSIKDKFDPNSLSFYEKTFNIYPQDHYSSISRKKGNTLPGLIAFLFFSGSYIFLFFMMMCFSLVAFIFEYLMFKSSAKNLFASALIAMVVTYRFAHFGYLPAQSYLLFGSLISIITIFFIIRIIAKIYKKN